jgi:hypothetical protein
LDDEEVNTMADVGEEELVAAKRWGLLITNHT